MNVHQLLDRAKRGATARVHAVGVPPHALTCVTHDALAVHVELLAGQLLDTGLTAGDIVVLAGVSSIEWLLADLALLRLGCIPCPVGEGTPFAEVRSIVQRYGARACVYVHQWPSDTATVPPVGSTLGLRVEFAAVGVSPPQSLHSDTFSLAFSSGTTGMRKCLQLSSAGIEHTMGLAARAWKLSHADHLLLFLPLANIQQRTLSYTALSHACDLTISPASAAFRALKERPVSVLVAPPSFYETLRRQSELGHRSPVGPAMRLMLVGSAPVGTQLLEAYQRARLPLFEVYGMNEFGWIAFNLPDDNVLGSAGALAPEVSLVAQPTGELVVHGPAPQSVGYYVDGVQEHASVHVAPCTVATGDLGALGPDGRLRLVGRRKNVIILPAGQKVAPEVLERTLEQCDSRIAQALVFLPKNAGVLSCAVWVHGELSARDLEAVREHVARASRSFARHERLGALHVRSARELSVEPSLFTKNGKPVRAEMLRVIDAVDAS